MEKFRRAWDELNNCPIDIKDLSRTRNGKKCGCRCIECEQSLVAYQGFINAWHFRHKAKTDCKGGPMTALHWMAQYLLRGDHTINTKNGQVRYSNGTMEFLLPRSRFKADVAGDKGDGSKFLIEIFVTHELQEEGEKVKHIRALKMHSIEINLSQTDPNIDNKTLLELLLRDVTLQRIICQPESEDQSQPASQKLYEIAKKERTVWDDISEVAVLVAGVFGFIKLIQLMKGSSQSLKKRKSRRGK